MSDMAKGRKGGILMLALLVMFVGAIILGGLFLYLDTSLSLATKSEDEAINFYAADSGVEDAIIWLQQHPWGTSSGTAGWEACDPRSQECENTYLINSRNVSVNVENPEGFGNLTFKIDSTATNNDESTSTTVVSYVEIEMKYIPLYAGNALISNSDLTGGSETLVVGGAIYTGDLDIGGNWDGNVTWVPEIPDWPVAQVLIDHYIQDVDVDDPYLDDVISITEDTELGPLYWSGDKLVIKSDNADVTLKLTGTIYVQGELEFNFGSANSRIDLNGQTIFAEGTTDIPAIQVTSGTTFDGSGAILATGGDIYIATDVSTTLGDPSDPNYILCMAVDGKLDMQSTNEWYGTLAGNTLVTVQSDGKYIYKGYSDINFPYASEGLPTILTYDIIDR